LEDEPLGYDPSHGAPVTFHLSYRQRGSVPEDPAVFGVGTNWSCSFRAYLVPAQSLDPTSYGTNEMLLHKGGAGWILYAIGAPQFDDGSILTQTNGGYQIEYADGSTDVFERTFTSSSNVQMVFMTSHSDPAGNATTFNYVPSCYVTNCFVANGHFTNDHLVNYSLTNCFLTNCFLTNCCFTNCVLTNCSTVNCSSGNCCRTSCCSPGPATVTLLSVQDPDGLITQLYYENPSFPNQITKVVDPFQRTNTINYDGLGRLWSIVDVAGMASSVTYDPTNQSFISTLTTPYGDTTFRCGETLGTDALFIGTNYIVRFTGATLPTGGTQLSLYRDDCTGFMPSHYSPVPRTVPLTNTFDNVDQNYRNSFDWGPLQYAHLSQAYLQSGDVTQLTASDYAIAHLQHWLIADSDYFSDQPSHVVSADQAPSPDGTTPGQITWYDYDNRWYGLSNWIGTSAFQSFTALVLPDGTTRFSHYGRNLYGQVTNDVSTYSQPSGAIGLRTNVFTFATNNIDLLLHTGPLGEQVVMNRYLSTQHQPDASFDALNQETRYTYNANHQVVTVSYPTGLTTSNIYFTGGAAVNQLQTTIDIEIGKTNSFTYANGLVFTHTDERGLTTTNLWDNLQRLVGVAYPDGTASSNIYTLLDLTDTEDRLGNWTHYGYNAIRQKVAATNALGVVTTYDYCPCGALNSVTRALNTPVQQTTSYSNDYTGKLLYTLNPDGYNTTNGYNALGQLVSTTDGLLRRSYSYNNQGLQTNVSVLNGAGPTLLQQSAVLDIEDRSIRTTDLNGVALTNTFDPLGRLLSRAHPDGGVENFGYSARGMIAYTNQLTFPTFYAYDAASRKVAETNANGEITQFVRNSAGDLTTLIDPNTNTTRWNFDAYGHATNEIDARGTNIFFYAFDASGRMTNRWTPAMGNTAYIYDPVGNLLSVTGSSSTVSYICDALNRVSTMTDALGTSAYTYDAAGELLTEGGLWASDAITNTYDHRVRTSMTIAAPAGSNWVQTYVHNDPALRLTSITSPIGNFGYQYTNVGTVPTPAQLVSAITFPSGAGIGNTYSPCAQVLSTVLSNPVSHVLNSHTYAYNLGNQRTQQTFTSGNYINYSYDPAGQLTQAAGAEANSFPRAHEQFGYAYDPNGNVRSRTNGTLLDAFNVNSLNELTTASPSGSLTLAGTTTARASAVAVNGSNALVYADFSFAVPGLPMAQGANTFTAVATDLIGRSGTNTLSMVVQPASFTYDLNGNLTGDGLRNLAYDSENELTSVWATNSWRSDFVYDGRKRRRIRREFVWSDTGWTLQNEVRYVYDGNVVVQERDSNNVPTVTYTRGLDLSGSMQGAGGIGGLLARTVLGPSLAPSFYHSDANGNVTCMITGSEAIAARYSYDPFGRVLTMSGPLAAANLYRFSSMETHAASGLTCYLYRCYDPSLQRWLNRDPMGEPGFQITRSRKAAEPEGEPNCYLFVGNNAVSRLDYLGLFDWEKLFEKWEDLIEHQAPGGDFAGALRVFGCCNSMGLALAWAKRQYDDCIADAIMGDPKKDSEAEKACEKKWTPRIKKLQKTYDDNCRGKD
jgi:RHS repeat-associated protein